MTVKLQLDNQMMNCPICWENFVLECQRQQHAEMPDYTDFSVTDDFFARMLAPYNASVHFSYSDNYVKFATAADRTHFVLRWS